jgi:hypothetical protein
MLVTSITTLLQESGADANNKHLAGNIKKFDDLLDPGIVSRLEAAHGGSFSFLAFDPGGDTAIVEYLRSGTLAVDSGASHLCLFTLQESARGTKLVEDAAWGSVVEIESGHSIAADVLQSAFGDEPAPSLPGVLLFSSLTRRDADAIWVALGGCSDARAVRQLLRDVFRLARAATERSLEKQLGLTLMSPELGRALQREKIPYRRTGKYSAQEWFVGACRTAWAHRSDIATVAGFAGL